ncbi:MAG: hypothetical protein H6595_12705 [Flavobacteriales bacterium]|nr:hypothetical protein [Flavobacteriales bacterium]MCB9168323.1 hypothetical protein [Flavobacteriales bacterium]
MLRALRTDRSKLIAGAAIILLALSLGWNLHQQGMNHDLADDLDLQRNENVRMVREQRDAQQDLVLARTELSRQEEHAAELEAERHRAQDEVAGLRMRIDRLQGAAAEAGRWKKDAEGLQQAKAVLEQQLMEARSGLDRMNGEKLALEARNLALKQQIDQLAADQATIDQSLLQAFQGRKERMTVVARRTRKVQLTMMLPPGLAGQVDYRITDPAGRTINGDDPAVSVITFAEPGPLLAGGEAAPTGNDRVKLVYDPKEKLKPGLYKIEVVKGDRRLGTTYIALR